MKFLLVLILPSIVSSFNYLLVNPVAGFSHVKHMSKIADALADSGHNVTVFQYYHTPMKNLEGLVKNPNVEIINYYPTHMKDIDSVEERTFPEMWDTNEALTLLLLPSLSAKQWEPTCREVLLDKKLHERLKSRKFDAAVVEIYEISGLYLANLLQIPATIATLSMVRIPGDSQQFGQGSLVGYLPYSTRMGANAGFLDRLFELVYIAHGTIFYKLTMHYQYNMYRDILKDEKIEIPHWHDIIIKSPVYITNANPYLDYAMPTAPNVIPVGGFTMDLEKKVPKLPNDYDVILNERKYAVFVSFGSVVRSVQMPDSFKTGLIGMFRSMPNVTFIWKYENDQDEDFKKRLPSNVYLKSWVPQHALLADERVDLFVTHGGLGSTMEVAYSGKPAIVVPLFGDQPMNSLMLARHRGALTYNKFDLPNSGKLASTVREMLSNPSYKIKAAELNNVLRNQPINPKEMLVKHMEFAVKFPNFKSQTPEILSAGIIAYYYVDVILFLSISSFAIIFYFFRVIRFILRKISISVKTKSD